MKFKSSLIKSRWKEGDALKSQ